MSPTTEAGRALLESGIMQGDHPGAVPAILAIEQQAAAAERERARLRAKWAEVGREYMVDDEFRWRLVTVMVMALLAEPA